MVDGITPGVTFSNNPELPASVADNLLLPASGGGGLWSAHTVGSDIARILVSAGVTGASVSNGVAANATAYVAFLDNIFNTAGAAAVSTWLADH